MRKISFISILSLFIIMSCNKKATENEIESIENNEKNSVENYDEVYGNAGELINDIGFNLLPTKEQEKTWGKGIIHSINIENAIDEVERLQNANEIVITETSVKLVLDYPLKKPAFFEITNSNGFSRKDLIRIINEKYKEVYNREEQTANVKTIPLNERKDLINRNETDGEYGIWGHDLQDLYLNGIEVFKNHEGKITLILQIES